MYEDPKTLKMPVIPATVEQQMLASLIRIEGLLTGILTAVNPPDVQKPAPVETKRVGRNRS